MSKSNQTDSLKAKFEKFMVEDNIKDLSSLIMNCKKGDYDNMGKLIKQMIKERKDLILPVGVTLTSDYDVEGDKVLEEYFPFEAVRICNAIFYQDSFKIKSNSKKDAYMFLKDEEPLT